MAVGSALIATDKRQALTLCQLHSLDDLMQLARDGFLSQDSFVGSKGLHNVREVRVCRRCDDDCGHIIERLTQLCGPVAPLFCCNAPGLLLIDVHNPRELHHMRQLHHGLQVEVASAAQAHKRNTCLLGRGHDEQVLQAKDSRRRSQRVDRKSAELEPKWWVGHAGRKHEHGTVGRFQGHPLLKDQVEAMRTLICTVRVCEGSFCISKSLWGEPHCVCLCHRHQRLRKRSEQPDVAAEKSHTPSYLLAVHQV